MQTPSHIYILITPQDIQAPFINDQLLFPNHMHAPQGPIRPTHLIQVIVNQLKHAMQE